MTTRTEPAEGQMAQDPDRNLALELVRATEAAAIAAARYMGYGDKKRSTRPRWTRCAGARRGRITGWW